MNKKGFEKLIDLFNIRRYKIRVENGVEYLDVDGNVSLSYRRISCIPFRFGKVSGDFECSSNVITSLKGCPEHVGGSFNCSFNKLTSLEYSPITVGLDYSCNQNELISLYGITEIINGDCYISGNQLSDFEYLPKIIGKKLWAYRLPLFNEDFLDLFNKGIVPEKIKCDKEIDIFAEYRQWQIKNIIDL